MRAPHRDPVILSALSEALAHPWRALADLAALMLLLAALVALGVMAWGALPS